MSPEKKNRLAGTFLMAHGGLLALLYILFFGIFVLFFNDPEAPKELITIFIAAMSIFGFIFAVPQIIGGWKIYKQSADAKIWGIIASVMACMSFPLGTAAGVFALIFLLGGEGDKFYQSLAEPKYIGGINEVEEIKNRNFQNQENPEMHGWR